MTGVEPTRFESFKAEDVQSVDIAQMAAILDLQARVPAFQRLKAWAMTTLAPKPGESALDIGSGTGEDVQAFAAAVGPSGRAVGAELNPGLREEASRRAAAAGVVAEFVHADALELPFDDGSFDVVRSERVFQHLADPYAAAREIARVLRPGGRVVLIDTDWMTAVMHPLPPDLEGVMADSLRTQFTNPRSGSRLRHYVVSAGLKPTSSTAETWLQEAEMAHRPPASLIGPQNVQRGVITQEQSDALQAGFRSAGDEGWFHMSLTMFAVGAVKP